MIKINLTPKQRNYGIPYQGNKSKIIKHLSEMFPVAENFYDLFGGGFSVTHYQLMNNPEKFKYLHFNEIRPGICDLIRKAIAGEFNYSRFKPEWISRDDFHAKKDSDPYVKMIWSFGNNGKDYMFSPTIEKQKKSLHQAVVFGEFNDFAMSVMEINKWETDDIKERRLYCRRKVVTRKGELQQLQQLERLQQLQQLERLEQLERLSFYSSDYREVPIKENSIIYCDIPYHHTVQYDGNKHFNHEEFFEWAANHKCPVYISEYNISDTRFTLVKEIETRSTMAAKGPNKSVERLYCNRAALAIQEAVV